MLRIFFAGVANVESRLCKHFDLCSKSVYWLKGRRVHANSDVHLHSCVCVCVCVCDHGRGLELVAAEPVYILECIHACNDAHNKLRAYEMLFAHDM